jgi:hypothetical protein
MIILRRFAFDITECIFRKKKLVLFHVQKEFLGEKLYGTGP